MKDDATMSVSDCSPSPHTKRARKTWPANYDGSDRPHEHFEQRSQPQGLHCYERSKGAGPSPTFARRPSMYDRVISSSSNECVLGQHESSYRRSRYDDSLGNRRQSPPEPSSMWPREEFRIKGLGSRSGTERSQDMTTKQEDHDTSHEYEELEHDRRRRRISASAHTREHGGGKFRDSYRPE